MSEKIKVPLPSSVALKEKKFYKKSADCGILCTDGKNGEKPKEKMPF